MKKMKKFKLLVVSLLVALFAVPFTAFAEEENNENVAADKEKITIYMFRGEGCGFCAKALTFFDGIKEEYGKYFNLVTYEVWNDSENAELFDDVAEYLNEKPNGVPYIIIGTKTYGGFDESWGDEIKKLIVEEYNKPVEERTDVIKIVKNKKDDNTAIIVTSIVLVAGIIALVVFGRRGMEESSEETEEETVLDETKEDKKKVKEEEQDNFLEEELDEDDFISEPVKEEKKIKNTKKVKKEEATNKEDKVQKNKKTSSTKKTTNSNKKKNTTSKKK